MAENYVRIEISNDFSRYFVNIKVKSQIQKAYKMKV